MSNKCTDPNVLCPPGTVCDNSSGQCIDQAGLRTGCNKPGVACPPGSKCAADGVCITPATFGNCNDPSVACPPGLVCNKNSGFCQDSPTPGYKDCRKGDACPSGYLCNGSTGGCDVQDDVCVNQGTFNDAFYHALNHSRKKDQRKLSGVMAFYLVVHTLCMIIGVILALTAQPPENRVVHLTLAIVFSPAYLLAYAFNAF